MPIKTEQLEEPGLILTPVIDIMFLLLIFFMVGTQFTEEESRFDIKLPTVSDILAVTSLPDPATVSLTANGEIYLDGKPMGLAELEERLVAMKENYPGQAVLIRGDGALAYQSVINVLEVVKRAGISTASLKTLPREKE